jgi:hypothetical protein
MLGGKVTIEGHTHDLTLRIDGRRNTAGVTIDGPEIRHVPFLPEKRVAGLIACKIRRANNFSRIVDRARGPATSKGHQVLHWSRLRPKERVKDLVPG